MTRPLDPAVASGPTGEIDLRALGAAIRRRRRVILVPTILAFLIVAVFVNVVTPRYTAETQVLLENQETFFTRPNRSDLQSEQNTQVDQEAVASQVQLINSRDIARRAIDQLHLAGNPEFDPLASGLNPLTRVLILLGVIPDPTRDTVDTRLVNKFLDKLVVFSPPKTRVITIQFTSRDPELAARTANAVAQLYLREQSAAKRATARQAADALGAQIADLRTKLLAADDEREKYRLSSGLLAGSNNMTISGQQLADINSDLSKARSAQADAQAKASMIRELIRAGKAADVPDVINNDTVRRVAEQRVAAQAQLARESRTLLPGHPRIKELTGQLAEYDVALKAAAKQAAQTLENEAKIAGQRVANLEAVLGQQKQVAGVANVDEVHLRALERIAQSLKDQLESSTTKYQEALARQSSTATPADARVISSATRPQEPSFPKKIPFIVFGTIAAFVFALGYVVAAELLTGRAAYDGEAAATREAERDPAPAPAGRNWAFPDTTRDEADPVFGPVAQPVVPASVPETPAKDRLRGLANGGMLAATLDYLKAFGRSADASRKASASGEPSPHVAPRARDIGWDDHDVSDATGAAGDFASSVDSGSYVEPVADRIVALHVPGRGLQIVGTGPTSEDGAAFVIALGRLLSGRGRAVLVDLNRLPISLAPLAGTGEEGLAKVAAMHGLAELLAGRQSFAEVIHRDSGSRLHFIPTGLVEADFRDFDLILDALSETYDFVLLLAPAFPQSEIAKIMAPYADFVVLAPGAVGPSGDFERELVAAGAREVLVAGPAHRGARRDVA